LLHYFRRDFHPNQERSMPTSAALAESWLMNNAISYRVVR
jgi:hypothetical protein